MSLADFVNRIVSTLPGAVFVEISALDRYRTRFTFAHHVYVVATDYGQFEVWEVVNDLGKEDKTAFSRRIAGILNGWKRNETGEMVKPVGVVSRG